jgi:hypothetical protein
LAHHSIGSELQELGANIQLPSGKGLLAASKHGRGYLIMLDMANMLAQVSLLIKPLMTSQGSTLMTSFNSR